MTAPDFDLALLKDIGGWAVVLLIVRWMMSRIDKLIASSDSNMRAAIDEFREFRVQETKEQAALQRSQIEILESVRRLHRGR